MLESVQQKPQETHMKWLVDMRVKDGIGGTMIVPVPVDDAPDEAAAKRAAVEKAENAGHKVLSALGARKS